MKLNEFIISLKLRQLRRIYKKDYVWFITSGINKAKLFTLGGYYAQNITAITHNPFWIDILKAWLDFTKKIKIDNLETIVTYQYG